MLNSRSDKFDGEELIRRYQAGNCTAEERQMIEEWYENIHSGTPLPDEETMMADLAVLHRRFSPNRPPRIRISRLSPRRMARYVSVAAAALLLVLGFAFYFQWIPGQKKSDQQARAHLWSAADQISPGGNRATLILPDGRSMELNPTQTGIVLGEDGIRYADGSLLLEQQGPEGSLVNLPATDQKLIISTPAGGTYQVLLSDGSKVWLNAASTLTYPAQFSSGADRVVELDGEAYFEVTRKSANEPFLVKTGRQAIKVLGTQFNVTAYAGEAATITTLVEGKVGISPIRTAPADGGAHSPHPNEVILLPNQQSILEGQTIRTRPVDVSPFIAWKDGAFSFSDKSFQQVLADIGRWYDLEIVYEGPVPAETFFGEAYRSEKLSVILKMLESKDFEYRLDNRTLTIINL